MGVPITFGSNTWIIDGSGFGQVNLPTALGANGAARLVGKFNRGSNYNEAEVTPHGNLRVGQDSLLFFESFTGNFINTRQFNVSLTTMTVAQAGDFLTLNSGSSIAASAYANIRTWRTFPFHKNYVTSITHDTLITSYQSNVFIELGIGYALGLAAPTDGAFFRYSSTTLLQAVVNTGGTEQTVNLTLPTVNVPHKHTVRVSDYGVDFYIDDLFQTTILAPAGYTFPFLNEWQPILQRIYHGATAPSVAVQIKLGQTVVTQRDLNSNRLWSTVMAGCGYGCYQMPTNAGVAVSQTANFVNSTAPVSAVLSNVTPSYTTLGGQWQFTVVAGSETEYALFGCLVPANGKNLVIRGVRIDAFIMGAAVVTTPILLQWSLGVGSSAASLATVEGNGTCAPARIPLGVQSFLAAAPVGAAAAPVDIDLDAPVYVPSGSYIHIVLKMPVATAGSTIVRGMVNFNGYFE